MTRPPAMRMLVALLLVISAAAFVIGVAAERSKRNNEAAHQTEAPTATTGERTGEDGENGGAGGESAEGADLTGESAENHSEGAANAESASHSEGGERLLGIDPESTSAAAAAIIASLLLAVANWAWDAWLVLLVAVFFGLLFAAIDVREAFHQAGESRGGLVALALVIAVLHLAVATTAWLALKQQRTSVPIAGV